MKASYPTKTPSAPALLSKPLSLVDQLEEQRWEPAYLGSLSRGVPLRFNTRSIGSRAAQLELEIHLSLLEELGVQLPTRATMHFAADGRHCALRFTEDADRPFANAITVCSRGTKRINHYARWVCGFSGNVRDHWVCSQCPSTPLTIVHKDPKRIIFLLPEWQEVEETPKPKRKA